MYRLFSILSQYRNTILFVVLELIAFYCIIRYNDYQRHIMGDALMDFSASVQSGRNGLTGYFDLRDQNESLMQDNKHLREELAYAQVLIDKYEAKEGLDTLKDVNLISKVDSLPYRFIPCHVIRNTVHKNYNYLVLDVGKEDGVEKDMGVLSPDGIAGRIIRVGDNYSQALSCLNRTFKLSLQALDPQGNWVAETAGIFEWKGGDPRFAYLNSIPETADLKEGYEIVTSESSLIFPPGYKVGKVHKITEAQEEGFFNAQIKLVTDFSKLDNVYLVKSSFKTAIDSLSKNLPGDE